MGADGDKPLGGYAVRELLGHKRRVTTLAWSGNGKKLATGSGDQSVRIWSIEPHCQVSRPERSEQELKGHTATVSCLAWKPGNSADTLVSGSATTSSSKSSSADNSIRQWDVRSGKCTSVINTSAGNIAAAWCPDGSSYAVLNQDNVLSIIDARKAKVVKSHKFPAEIYDVHWGPTPSHLMVASEKGCVDVLSLPTMDVLWSLRGHAAQCFSLAMSRSQKYIVSGGADAAVALWDLDNQVCVRTWAHMDHPVRGLSWSPDGRFIAYSTDQGELEVLSSVTGERLQELRLRGGFTDYIAWNPVYNVLAYCDEMLDPNSRDRSMVGAVGIFAPPKSS
mmetsp:Transcript_2481/g.6388  ORF Transcript_2481/g.6388 Transcript_2481/m.6388 type:complete len:335 (-) Transcript_2481:529-1533(-)|eukprot:CAMPEP_0202864444 /NCGR_PEP_ID=MMETSP1391-20130828/4680_1 /ASSEMBLY_ACC=CAM_ASM_000867 /TAXON_ID=1034604 /ORGANISM="Chlamydomonas leiostraca, Strain SAG 11-49" /LENGTH=334 /DNA_ID=CAMNT_0049544183 /DNA_START=107 /DNA_END=1111 /DNA_ORIENTATION=+